MRCTLPRDAPFWPSGSDRWSSSATMHELRADASQPGKAPSSGVSAAATPGPSGWAAHLQLRFAAKSGATFLEHQAHSGPLLVQRPFYPEGPGVCHVYVLHPPGGLVPGDTLALEVDVGAT